MTRKDYVLLHSCFKSCYSVARCLPDGKIRADAVKKCAETVAYCIRAENPRFDVARFMRDCGVTE